MTTGDRNKTELDSNLPLISGGGRWICLSNRPGRINAGSSTSGLFVPAKTTTLVVDEKPGIKKNIKKTTLE